MTITVQSDSPCPDPADAINGCCFNNFGAAVTIDQNTYLNIHCNLVNEVSLSGGALWKGIFENQGEIRVQLDWINNGYNDLFPSQQGNSNTFGGYQRIRGNSPTHFYNLALSGGGKKELFVDAFAHSLLDLGSNELAAQQFTFYDENQSPGSIQRATGFVSTDGAQGYLSRKIDGSALFLYPLGSTNGLLRYRPLELSSAATPALKAGFLNHDPAADGYSAKSPDVQSVHTGFYHRLLSPVNPVQATLTHYFSDAADGSYQSSAFWAPSTVRWEAGPFGTVQPVNSEGLKSVLSSGLMDWSGKFAVLARTGFYINTGSFGGGNAGVTVTVNPIGATAGSTGQNDNGDSGLGGSQSTGGTTIITPSPVPGDYEIEIASTDGTSSEGTVIFNVDANGNINNVYFGQSNDSDPDNPTPLGELSPDLYQIDNTNSGITLLDTPPSLETACSPATSISMGSVTPYVLESGESIVVSGLSGITITGMAVYDRTNTVTATYSGSDFVLYGTTATLNPAAMPAGSYRFELNVLVSGTPDTIKGYFIAR